ncbi:MAG: EF-P lysine aminoacylase EpmA [Proteobacteria bacterium]|nr:EF-P lysine aminoacylase EpmA [Pseudomonadota bacterium]
MSLLRFRNDLLAAVRAYFRESDTLEVSTPLIRPWGTPEPHLQNLVVQSGGQSLFLQTSPEFAMKVLLARYRQDIYQICAAVRAEELGARHDLEFQMLEWYRVDIGLMDLAEDVRAFWRRVGEALAAHHELPGWQSDIEMVSYAGVFEAYLQCDPHTADIRQLQEKAHGLGIRHLAGDASRADWLDALFATAIEPGLTAPTLVFGYPACQSALAEIDQDSSGVAVSRRFELFANGLELANAYQELTDPQALYQRFAQFNVRRLQEGREFVAVDEALMDAMQSMPRSAGIALGVDRLAMAWLAADSISQVRP